MRQLGGGIITKKQFNEFINKWKPVGEYFCAAPTSCKCVNGECEGIFDIMP